MLADWLILPCQTFEFSVFFFFFFFFSMDTVSASPSKIQNASQKTSVVKVFVSGAPLCGVSALVDRFAFDTFARVGTAEAPRLGARFVSKMIGLTRMNIILRLKMWDVPHNELLASVYFRKANVAIVAFDSNKLSSLNTAKELMTFMVEQKVPNSIELFALVACKCDGMEKRPRSERRKLLEEFEMDEQEELKDATVAGAVALREHDESVSCLREAKQYAKKTGCAFLETSAKTGLGKGCFIELAVEFLLARQKRKDNPVSSDSRRLTTMPSWVPDESRRACVRCGKVFSVVTRRHHCRNCGEIFCSDCSPFFKSIPRFGLKNVRICVDCSELVE